MIVVPMILAFIVLSGIALLYADLLRLHIAEGMVMSVFTVIACMSLFSRITGGFGAAKTVIIILCLAGIALEIVRCVRDQKNRIPKFCSVYWFVLLGIVVVSSIIYSGAVIQNTNELTQWALIPKYMINTGKLWRYSDVSGNHTNLFHVFSMMFSDYNEGLLYTSAALLYWIGLLLPFGRSNKGRVVIILLYVFTMHFALYALFYYGSKSLVPELPFICFAGGIGAWILSAGKKRTNLVVLAAGCFLLLMINVTAGIIFSVLFWLIVLYQYSDSADLIPEKIWILGFSGISCLLLIIGGIYCNSISRPTKALMLYENKDTLKAGVYLSDVFGKSLCHTDTPLHFTFISILILAFVIMAVTGALTARTDKSVIAIGCGTVLAIVYLIIGYGSLVHKIGYGRLLEDEAILPLLSVYCVALFIISIGWLAAEHTKKSMRFSGSVIGVLCLLFLYCCINKEYLPYTSSFSMMSLEGYKDIYTTEIQAKEVAKAVKTKGRVYLIDQKADETENMALCEAKYLLYQKVSNYQKVPWKFEAGGSYVGNELNSQVTLFDFMDDLSSGKYRYVWIYRTDDYLNKMLPQVLKADEIRQNQEELEEQEDQEEEKNTMRDGQLYKVIYKENGEVDDLELIKNLNVFDNRQMYYEINNIME